ncbi:MAG: YbhB/YbcL family Raf kinase inhibitor-like protein [Calditrichaeota bacterium]|nr:YbhB/YbcL family Raf kinase inhibitor-like protein [Calditrichota bacterium]RQW06448.1 MAG: YbhB/YbcL family Raf kinase inhibitor-like protein [Calditrichota bacterium]
MQLSSPAFGHKGHIPEKYTCDGENISPPLVIEDVPENTRQLVLIVEDPDAPSGTFIHWVLYGIPVIKKIDEDSVPGIQGLNDFGDKGYGGPCPPSGEHRYFFRLYALDEEFDMKEGLNRNDLRLRMEGHILEEAELVGLYSR